MIGERISFSPGREHKRISARYPVYFRPAFGQEKSTVGMFKIEPDGKTASRISVELGRGSVTSIEIVRGLKEGDQVILSDMSRWDNVDRIRLE